MWKAFCELMEAMTPVDSQSDVVEAANLTFAALEDWLCRPSQ
jgi:heme oxygenase